LLAVLQPLHVGQKSAALAGEEEAIRRLLAPGPADLRPGEAIEGAVDLDAFKPARVVGELLPLAHLVRIERPPPVPVDPA
jgi:hypothetical protein